MRLLSGLSELYVLGLTVLIDAHDCNAVIPGKRLVMKIFVETVRVLCEPAYPSDTPFNQTTRYHNTCATL